MRATRAVWCGLLALAGGVGAAEPAGGAAEEVWETAYLEGARVGHQRTLIETIADKDGSRLRTTTELELSVRRYGQAARLRAEQGTEELPDGRVVAVFLRQYQGAGQRLELTGRLDGDRMHVVIDNGRIDRRIWWNENVLSAHRLQLVLRERRPKAGERFAYFAYEPTVNAVVKRRAAVGAAEPVLTAAGRRPLLRVDVTTDRLEVPGAAVQLPPAVLWLDDDYVIQRRQIELEGLGEIVLLRGPREAAPAAAPAPAVDIGARALVPLNRAIPRAYAARAAIFRVSLRGEDDPAGAFVSDAHQEVRAVPGGVEIHVHPARGPRGPGTAAPGPEFLAPSYFLDSDDERIRQLARRTVAGEADPWRAALRIERWVHGAMRPDAAAPLEPAAQAARTLRGDCRHYALLTAALCRAAGVPARIAVGLLYVERDGRPALGFHMWAEVCVDGHWRGLDATLGRGGVSAVHLKVADHSWADVRSLTPLLPAQRVVGKLAASVVRVEYDN